MVDFNGNPTALCGNVDYDKIKSQSRIFCLEISAIFRDLVSRLRSEMTAKNSVNCILSSLRNNYIIFRRDFHRYFLHCINA